MNYLDKLWDMYVKQCNVDLSTEENQLKALKEDGWNISYIKNPSKEIQKTAINNHYWSIQYIYNPSKEIQELAYNKYKDLELLFHFCPNLPKSEKLWQEYIKQCKYDLSTEDNQLIAVESYGWYIKYIKNPSIEVQKAAINKNYWSIQYIHNPSLELKLEAIRLSNYNLELFFYYCPDYKNLAETVYNEITIRDII